MINGKICVTCYKQNWDLIIDKLIQYWKKWSSSAELVDIMQFNKLNEIYKPKKEYEENHSSSVKNLSVWCRQLRHLLIRKYLLSWFLSHIYYHRLYFTAIGWSHKKHACPATQHASVCVCHKTLRLCWSVAQSGQQPFVSVTKDSIWILFLYWSLDMSVTCSHQMKRVDPSRCK